MNDDTAARPRTVLAAVAVTLVGGWVAYVLLGSPPMVGAEDAAIGFRYARNLADGHGIVFNPGGERVEGFTSMSWLLISALVYAAVGPALLETVLFVLSIAMTAAGLWIVLRLLEERAAEIVGVACAILWVGSQGGFHFWSTLSLMDVAPWFVGLSAYLMVLHRAGTGHPVRSRWLAGVVVFLVLTRPEAMLVVPATAVWAWLAYDLTPKMRRATLAAVGISIAAVGALTVFRLAYFGYPLPNTYYTKVSPDVMYRLGEGLQYIARYGADHPLSWLPAVAVLGFLTVRMAHLGRRLLRRTAPARRVSRTSLLGLGAAASGLIVIGFASVVSGGGDHYQGHRFLQAYIAIAAIPLGLLATAVIRWLRAGDHGRWVWVVSSVAALVPVALIPAEWGTFSGHGLRAQAYQVGLEGRFVGGTLDEVFGDVGRPELGLWKVGGASYAYRGPVKDLLGLNWVAMGMSEGDRKGVRDHAAFNIDVFWSDPPDLMMPEPEAVLRSIGCTRRVLGGAMDGLFVSERFEAEFEPVLVRREDSVPMLAYARGTWLATEPPYVERLGWAYCDREASG